MTTQNTNIANPQLQNVGLSKEEFFKKFEMLEGLAMYAFVHVPDKGNVKYRIPPAYKVDLMLPDKEQEDKARALGLNVKSPNDKFKYPYVQIKSKTKEGRRAPRVLDSQRNPIPTSILVGNGSRVRVRFLPWGYGDGEISAILQETQVLDLVKYEPTPGEKERKGSFLEVVEGGFTVPTTGEVTA